SILHWRREDGAPHFLGLPPATTQAQLRQYVAISQEHDRVVNQPLARRLNPLLKGFGVGPLSRPLFESVVELADAYMQMTVPSFEFPRASRPLCTSSALFLSLQIKLRSRPGRMNWTARARLSWSRRE